MSKDLTVEPLDNVAWWDAVGHKNAMKSRRYKKIYEKKHDET